MSLIQAFLVAGAFAVGLGCAPRKSPPPTPPNQQTLCCSECKKAASQDPQARDLELLDCGSYAERVVNGRPGLTQECAQWFVTHPTMVGACHSSP
jgi:hypothetical protein